MEVLDYIPEDGVIAGLHGEVDGPSGRDANGNAVFTSVDGLAAVVPDDVHVGQEALGMCFI